MLDRGLRRRFDPLVEREARGGGGARRGDGRRAPRPARPADVHDRPADRARLRRRDQRRAARGRADPGLGPHRRRRRARAAGLGGRPRGVPARDERLRPGQGRADAARGAVQRGLLARPAPGPPRGHGRARPRRARASSRTAFHRSLIRSDARLDYPRVDRIFAGRRARRGAVGGSRSRPRAAASRGARRARGPRAARSRSSRSSRSSTSRTRATSPALAPSEQTESHRLIEHLMIAANEAVADAAGDAQAAGAVPRARAAGARARRAPGRAARGARRARRRRCPTRCRRSRRASWSAEISRLVDEHVRRTGRGRQALTSLVLRSLKQARYAAAQHRPPRAAVAALLPLHVADPALPGPDLPPRAAGRDRRRGGARRRRPRWRARRSGARLRERDAAAIERTADDVARAFLLERRAVPSAAGRPSGRAR